MVEYSEEYVQKLRQEAAKYRTQLRELEAQTTNHAVEVELAKRGILADPSWVTVEEGQEIGKAIDSLVERYPHLKGESQAVNNDSDPLDFLVNNDSDPLDFLDDEPAQPRVTPKPIAPSSPNSNQPKPVRASRITKRSIEEIRKDPKARSKVRYLYRDLLQKGSNQSGD